MSVSGEMIIRHTYFFKEILNGNDFLEGPAGNPQAHFIVILR